MMGSTLVSDNVSWQNGRVSRVTRGRLTRLRGATVWFTGLPGAGKSTVARAVECELLLRGRPAYVLDGDNLRHGLTGDLSFTATDRAENVRRVAHVAEILSDAGIVALVAVISPYAEDRLRAREVHERRGHAFFQVWVDTPRSICEQRDPKGLYGRARRGELRGLTGVDAPYEAAIEADLRLRDRSVAQSVSAIISALEALEVIGTPAELRRGRLGAGVDQPQKELTLREHEIMRMIELGLSNKEIALELSIKLATVKNHVHHILDKLEATCRGQAVALWRMVPDAARASTLVAESGVDPRDH